jgi:hypothetical protein
MLRHWSTQPAKLWLGFMVLLSAHHFLGYSRQVTAELDQVCRALEEKESPVQEAVAAAG